MLPSLSRFLRRSARPAGFAPTLAAPAEGAATLGAARPSRRGGWRTAAGLVLVTLLAWGAASPDLTDGFERLQRRAIFQPDRTDLSARDGAPAGTQDVWIPVGDAGERLHAWWTPHPRGEAAPAVLYLHGARWNVSSSGRRLQRLHDAGFSVLAIDYRGFGRSDGDLPSEAQAYEDAMAGWRWLERHQPDPKRRFLLGHSLGGAIAVDLASRIRDLAGLVVEAAPSSIPDVLDSVSVRGVPVGWLSLGGLVSQRFDAASKIARVQAPVLLVHGMDDDVVPASSADRMFAAATAPKQLIKVPGATHASATWAADPDYVAAIRALVARAVQAEGAGGR